MSDTKSILEKASEMAHDGESIESIRNTTICERRRLVEAKFGKKMKIGNDVAVLLTSEEIEGLDGVIDYKCVNGPQGPTGLETNGN